MDLLKVVFKVTGITSHVHVIINKRNNDIVSTLTQGSLHIIAQNQTCVIAYQLTP